jgi:hypothetical protein
VWRQEFAARRPAAHPRTNTTQPPSDRRTEASALYIAVLVELGGSALHALTPARRGPVAVSLKIPVRGTRGAGPRRGSLGPAVVLAAGSRLGACPPAHAQCMASGSRSGGSALGRSWPGRSRQACHSRPRGPLPRPRRTPSYPIPRPFPSSSPTWLVCRRSSQETDRPAAPSSSSTPRAQPLRRPLLRSAPTV